MGSDKDKSQLTAAAELRRLAEERLRARTAQLQPPRNEVEQKLVHELEVHQIELEMQNAEFRQARNDAEAALEKYADLYDFAPVGYFTLDHEGIILSANLTGASFFGVERSRLPGRRFGLLVADEARPFFTEFLGKVFRNPGKEVCEVALLNEGNSPLFVRIEGVAAASGQECRLVLIDITERKLGEEKLRESEERLRQFYESNLLGIIYWNMNGEITAANDKFLSMVGYSREELQSGQIDWVNMTPPEYRHLDEASAIELKAAGGNTEPFEKVYIHKDGTHIPIIIAGAMLDEARFNGVAFVLDITERKRAEEQIKASLAEKEVMLKEIHHRVKNNLQVISSLVSLQADTLADERIREEFNDVRDRVRSMALVHEKLYQTGDLANVNFADYAASLLQYLWCSHGVLAEKVRLHLEVAPLALPIGAAVPCGLILNELAGNALKHAFPNSNNCEVTVELEHDPVTGAVCLRVCDNGVGLPPDLDWQQSRSLGLRLVQMLAGQLRGTVATGPGPGAEFRVIFPLKGNNSG